MKMGVYASICAFLMMSAGGCEDPSGEISALEGIGIVVLAEIERDDFTIRFTQSVNGKIAVSEEGPVDRPSYLGYFVTEFKATPLEMFMALDGDGDAPKELTLQHAATTSESPRRLNAPNFAFRSITQSEYAASCTLTNDGGWFDNEWTTRGWTYHWYHNSSANDNTPRKVTSNLITHLCNNSVSPDNPGSLKHYLADYDNPNQTPTYVAGNEAVNLGNRSVIVVAGTSGDYEASAVLAAWASGNFKLGLMAP